MQTALLKKWLLACAITLLGVFQISSIASAQTTQSQLGGGIVINEILVDPNGPPDYDTDGNGTAQTEDEFIELYNTSASPIDISGYQLWRPATDLVWFTFPAGSIVPAGRYAVVITKVQAGGALPVIAGSLFFDAGHTGGILSNGPGNVVLLDPVTNEYIQASYNGSPAVNPTNPAANYTGFPAAATLIGAVEDFGTYSVGVSLTRSPDGDVTIVTHTSTTGGTPASPGGVGAPAVVTTLFFSEYVEGSSGNNKVLEIYNPTTSVVNLATDSYTIERYANGGTVGTVITLTGTIAVNGTFVISHPSAVASILAVANQTSSVMTFNGDDAMVLKKSGVIIDVIGQVGTDPGTQWGVTGGISTLDRTIRRKCAITAGDTNDTNAFDPSIEWEDAGQDVFTGLGSHCTTSVITVTGTLTAFSTTAISIPSASQTYQVRGTGLTTDLVITAPTHFEVSLDGITFTSSVTIPFATANAGNTTVYVHYLPTSGTSHTGNVANASTGAVTVNVAVIGALPLALTKIYDLQGAGTATPFALGTAIATSGVVTADFQTDAQMRGFFIQDITGDANVLTSDGIFVYILPSDPAWVDVAVGDVVTVQGKITEYFGLTQINTVILITKTGTNALPAPVAVTFPETVNGDLERFEGMYATITNTMTVAQNYFWGRYGQLSLSAAGRLIQPTQQFIPGSPAYIAEVDRLQRNLIFLDDASTVQNPNPLAYTGLNNTVRAGDEVTGLTGIVHYDKINPNNTNDYTFHPTVAPTFTRSNPRTVAPTSVGAANIKVASFNVLNYFITYPSVNPNARGADNALELQRQEDKLVPAILGLGADVIGLMEISNIDGALAKLVTLLNAATAPGTWATITHPFPGTDAIKVAIIYKPAVVTPFGAAVSSVDAILDRPPLAQTFTLVSNAEKFTVVVNHFKSKGSCGGGANGDLGDGAGCWNLKRTQQAIAIRTLVTSIQTTTSDDDVLVIGDLNAYAMEDPIRNFTDNGFVNLVDQYVGNANGYSFIFDSYSGYLDQALATASLAAQTTGTTEWHLNGDEPFVIDYNTDFKAVAPIVTGSPDYWAATPYRSSDHDPVIIGLNLQTPPLVTLLSPADNATNVAITTDLVLTFDRDVQAGTGNITVTDGVTPITFPIAGNALATVTILNNVVTINLTADLANATNYNVLIPVGVIQSTTGSDFAGFALATDWNFTTVAVVPPAGGGGGTRPTVTTPINFKAVAVSTSQINLTWEIVSGATGYILYRDRIVIATLGTVTSFQDTGLMSDTFYSYKLVATNNGSQSNPAQANARTFPAAPTLLSVTNACSGSGGVFKVSSTGALYHVYADSVSTLPLFETDNATITSPSITQTTTFYVSLVSNGRESRRTAVTITVNPLPIANILEDRIFSCSSTGMITAEAVTGASYTWIVNEIIIETTSTPTYQVTRSGNYQVRVGLNGCWTLSDITPVRLNYLPIAQIAQGVVVRSCESSATISAKYSNQNDSTVTYEWTRNNVVVGNTASVSVSESGVYTLTVTQFGCSASDEVTVEISTINPNVSFTASQTTFCPEEEVTLTVDNPEQNVVYTWVRNGRVLRSVRGIEYKTSIGGEYRVLASQNSCSVISEPIKITRTRVEPVYLRKENYILSVESITPITDVVWFFEGEENSSFAGQMSITPEVAGNYSARVTFETGCKGSTRTVYYSPKPPVITGEDDIISIETIVYPNPSKTGIFRVQLSNSITSDVIFTITDNIGRILENKVIKATETSTLQTLDLSQYAAGMYALTIDTEQGKVIKKIIIQ